MAATAVLFPAVPPDFSDQMDHDMSSLMTFTPVVSNPVAEAQPAAAQAPGREPFDPAKHLAFSAAPRTYTMEEIGYSATQGVSPIAVSEPFALFTPEAILRMRQEVLAPEVFANCQFSSNLARCQLRGFAAKYAPFVYDAWKDPETLRIVSQVAGVDLVTQMDLEIGHVNISVQSAESTAAELRKYEAWARVAASDEAAADVAEPEPIVGWHTDAYPFVCVTMLSDCTDMIGGETALRTGAGEIMKVRGPQMGCAVVLQGKYIEHQALAALGTTERITMVTSFRPRNPTVRDDTVLTTVRPISNLSELYGQFSEYRLEMLEERIRRQLREIREARAAGRGVSTARLKAFLADQELFLAHMNREMVDEDKVRKGDVDDSHLFTRESKEDNLAKMRPAVTVTPLVDSY